MGILQKIPPTNQFKRHQNQKKKKDTATTTTKMYKDNIINTELRGHV